MSFTQACIYLFKVNIGNARAMCAICSNLKAAEWCQWRHSDIFIDNFEQISHIILVFLLLNLRSIVEVNTCMYFFQTLEAVARRYSVIKVFSKICQNSQGNFRPTTLLTKRLRYMCVLVSCVKHFWWVGKASISPASVRRASHQPAFMGSCLTINHTCLPCLPRQVRKFPCVTQGGGWGGGRL